MKKITDSEFYMWRTLFAVAHADGVVSNEEIRFMAEALEDVPFSPDQKAVLQDDIKHPKDIAEMFGQISDVRDQARFFKFAQAMVHVDGDYGAAEQAVMLKLKTAHVQGADFDRLLGSINLEFDDEKIPFSGPGRPPLKKNMFSSFRAQFFRWK